MKLKETSKNDRSAVYVSIIISAMMVSGVIMLCYFVFAPLADAHAAVLPTDSGRMNMDDYPSCVIAHNGDAVSFPSGNGRNYAWSLNGCAPASDLGVSIVGGWNASFYYESAGTEGSSPTGTPGIGGAFSIDGNSATSGTGIVKVTDELSSSWYTAQRSVLKAPEYVSASFPAGSHSRACIVAIDSGADMSRWTNVSTWISGSSATPTTPFVWKCWEWYWNTEPASFSEDPLFQIFEPDDKETLGKSFFLGLKSLGYSFDTVHLLCDNYTSYSGGSVVAGNSVSKDLFFSPDVLTGSMASFEVAVTSTGWWSCQFSASSTVGSIYSNQPVFNVVVGTVVQGPFISFPGETVGGGVMAEWKKKYAATECGLVCDNLFTTPIACTWRILCPDPEKFASLIDGIYQTVTSTPFVGAVVDGRNAMLGADTSVSSASFSVLKRNGSPGFALSFASLHALIIEKIAASSNLGGTLDIFKSWMSILLSFGFTVAVIVTIKELGTV